MHKKLNTDNDIQNKLSLLILTFYNEKLVQFTLQRSMNERNLCNYGAIYIHYFSF